MDGGLFDLFEGSERQFLILIAIVPVAVFAIWYGSRTFGRARNTAAMRPKGRVADDHPQQHRSKSWRSTVLKLEACDPTGIGKAVAGPVRFVGVLVAARGQLGGAPGRECVWRNRAGGRPDAAVGAELVVLADKTGRCGIEGLEGAFVIAPAEKHTRHRENIALYLGDEVEVFGTFEPEKTGEDPDPAQIVYGTIVPDAGLDIRLLEAGILTPRQGVVMKVFAASFAALVALASCDKDKGTNPPDGDVASDDGGAKPNPDLPDVPQDPDPPQIVQGAHQYLIGNYKDAVELLAPVYADLKQRNQYRASGLAGGWLALAHAEVVVEDAEEPSQHALAMADHTGDKEVVALAKLGHGAFLMGQEDFEAASAAFEAAATAAPNTLPGALANLLRAESLIGKAFGGGEGEDVKDPTALETAKSAYAAAQKTAEAGTETEILMGRVEEGLAAVARYQRDKEQICAHSIKALGHFKKAGASDFLMEGSKELAVDFKCDLPKG